MASKYRSNNGNEDNSEIKKIIMKINKLEKLSDMDESAYADENGYADKVARNLKKLNTNQIRKFFSVIRKIDKKEEWKDIKPEFYLLKPKFAYASGRNNIPKPFYDLMMITMSKVDTGDDKENYDNFKTYVNFFEAIVAYHKFHFPNK